MKMEIQDSVSAYYARPDKKPRKEVHKVGRITRSAKKVWVSNKREQVFNGVCRLIEQGERAQLQRDVRRAKRNK
jgi:hypothetical protein